MHKMGGLWKYMPITAICFVIASLAMAGIPFLNGAVSKGAIEEATNAASIWWGYEWFAYAQIIGSILTFIYLIRAFYLIFLRKPKDEVREGLRSAAVHAHPIVIMVGLCVVLGFFPGLVEGLLQFAADALLHPGLVELTRPA